MQRAITGLLFVIVAGCGQLQYQADIANNRYAEIPVYADKSAGYVGEWTASIDQYRMRSVKIRGDGNMKICLSPSGGTEEAKIFLENGLPKIIVETGAVVNFLDVNKDYLLLDIYGKRERYYAGNIPNVCEEAFRQFK